MPAKQIINTRSSTEAELMGVNDVIFLVLWVSHFLDAQGYTVKDKIVYQDNQSTINLVMNEKMSSTKDTRHIEIRNKLSVKYCPTDKMLGDY